MIMVWNDNKDEILCREVLLFEPYQFKPCSHERGNTWKATAENLNASVTCNFKVGARSVRERLTGVVVKYKQKNKDELNASDVSPEHTSLDEASEEISEKMEETDKLHNQTTQENAINVQQDALKAQEMRQCALETLAETTKRKLEEPKSETKKKSRSSGSETLVYLREKAEKDQVLKLNEMLL